MRRLAASAAAVVFGLFGLFGAAGASSESGYVLGLLLFVAAVLFVFRMLKQHFDGVPEAETLDVWPEQPRNGWLLLAVLGVLGILGLFLAASGDVYLYWFGLFLFIACCVMGLVDMKMIYDHKDQMRHDQP